MKCTQQCHLVSFPKVRVMKQWFRHFNNHKEFHNEGTLHLFSLMSLYSYANFRSNTRKISGTTYMESPGQWVCKLGSLPRILRVHSKFKAYELMVWFRDHGFISFEFISEEQEIIRFEITDWQRHCTHLDYNYYSYKGNGFFFFPLPVGRQLIAAVKTAGKPVFSELDAIMDMWLHTVFNDPGVRGSEYMPVLYFSNMKGLPLLSYSYLAKRWGWSKSRVGRFILKAGEYGIISRVSFPSSHGSVISLCRYREMILGDDCEEIQIRRIGEILSLSRTLEMISEQDEDVRISVEKRVPPEVSMPNARESVKIQAFRADQQSFFSRQIPLVFYSSLGWGRLEADTTRRAPPLTNTGRRQNCEQR